MSREVASDGSPVPLGSWRSRPWLLVGAGTLVGLVAGLLVGILVGGTTGIPGSAEDQPPSRASVTVGVISETVEGSVEGWDFELPVFNATAAPVGIELVGLDGANFSLTSGEEENLAAGTWGSIPFSVTANCDAFGPGPLASVRLRVQARGGSSLASSPLPDRGSAVRGYHRAVCASADPVPASRLVGLWIVERVYGPNTWLTGTRTLRFSSDGFFVAVPEGERYSDGAGSRGRYRLEGELLTVGVFRNDGCAAPSTATWRVTVRKDEMSMVWVHGVCPSGEAGDAWVLRRVSDPGRVPGSPD